MPRGKINFNVKITGGPGPVLSLHRGYDVGYLTSAVGGASDKAGTGYYTSAAGGGGEPPGFWTGLACAVLGLVGLVDADVMRQLYHHSVAPDGSPVGRRPRPPGDAAAELEARIAAAIAAEGPFVSQERAWVIRNTLTGSGRTSVAFFDFTFSAPKSVSVAHAGYLAAAARARREGRPEDAAGHEARAASIIGAIESAARAVVARLETSACYVRTGHHGSGEGEWRDGAGLVAAAFVQHTSRDGDPQLHAHIAVLNRAQRADGADTRWRALDSRSLFRERLGAAATGDRVLMQELARAGFPLVMRPDGNGAEIAGVAEDTKRAFSSRRVTITAGLERLAAAYEQNHGRAPSRRALWSMRQFITLETRKGKPEQIRPAAEQLAAWEAHADREAAQALADVPGAIEREAAQRGAPSALDGAARRRAIRAAVAAVQAQSATWTVSDLMMELHRVLPVLPGEVDGAALVADLAAEAVSGRGGADVVLLTPAPGVTDLSVLGLRASDGQPVSQAPGAARYATTGQLDTEQYLLDAAARRVRPVMTPDEADGALAGAGLAEDQAEAARGLLATDRALTVFVGPAGTGKTHTLAAFAAAWTAATGCRVIGLTSATNAARVLASEGLAEAYNIADWLGKLEGTSETRGHLPIYRGDVLVIDEASQLSTADLAAIWAAADRAGARVILTGDTEQLASPDAGGAMRLIAAEHGYWQLREVRRFTAPWEGPASLRLRNGDVEVIAEYQRHGRIRGGDQDAMYAAAVRLWLGDHLAGRNTLLLATSDEEAAELARQAREQLVTLGRVDAAVQAELGDGNDASTGDLIRARQNNNRINAAGQPLTNRDVLRIDGWQTDRAGRHAAVRRQLEDGSWSAVFTVPASYLAEHAELAYAGNTHVAQGRTVDTGHMVISDATDRESLYVGMTRGRAANTAYVVTAAAPGGHVGGTRPAPELGDGPAGEPVPVADVLAGAMERERDDLTATEVIRQAQHDASAMPRLHARWHELITRAERADVDEAVKARLSEADYQRYLGDPQRPVLHRTLREAELAGHRTADVLDQVTDRPLDGARSVAAVLHGRVGRLDLDTTTPAATYAERTPELSDPAYAQPAAELADAMDHHVLELGEQAAARPPVWAVRYLGVPPPEPGPLREDWVNRVGQAAAYRELTGHDDPVEALGATPPGQDAERRAAYYTAASALEMPTEERALATADRGQLEHRVTAYGRAEQWAPPPVADELRNTAQAEADTTAQAAEAEAAGDQPLAASAEALARQLADRRQELEDADALSQLWQDQHQAERQAAADAAAELARRGEPAAAAAEQDQAAEAEADDGQGDPDSTGPVAEARAAAADRAAERAATETELDAEADRRQADHWRQVAAEREAAAWQPGVADPAPETDYEMEAEP